MRRTNLHAELLNGYFASRLVIILIHCEEFHCNIKFRQWDFFAYRIFLIFEKNYSAFTRDNDRN